MCFIAETACTHLNEIYEFCSEYCTDNQQHRSCDPSGSQKQNRYTFNFVVTILWPVVPSRLHGARGHVLPLLQMAGHGGTLSRTANKKLTKLHWPSRKRSPKRLLKPKSGEARPNRCPHFRSGPAPPPSLSNSFQRHCLWQNNTFSSFANSQNVGLSTGTWLAAGRELQSQPRQLNYYQFRNASETTADYFPLTAWNLKIANNRRRSRNDDELSSWSRKSIISMAFPAKTALLEH